MKILTATKKHAISKGQVGCVGEVQTVNIARGCAGSCIFCYARCYTGAPEPGTVLLYSDLPRSLRYELDAERRKAAIPPYVLFSTATDGFLGGPSIMQVTHAALEVLLNRRISISFSTRGTIPDETIALLSQHAPYIRITIPLVSMSEEYTQTWEPGTSLPQQRLFLIQRLLKAGIRPRLRLEPLIPFINDHTDQIHQVLSAIAGIGLTDATLSYFHLRPGVQEQIQSEAPASLRRLILGGFTIPAESNAWFHHLPLKQRLAGLRRIQRIGREHGIKISACHCQNPGLPAAVRCPIIPPEMPPAHQQISIFEKAPC